MKLVQLIILLALLGALVIVGSKLLAEVQKQVPFG